MYIELSIGRYYRELCKIILDDDDQQYIKVTELNEDGAEQNIVPINNIQKKSSSSLNIRYIFGHRMSVGSSFLYPM